MQQCTSDEKENPKPDSVQQTSKKNPYKDKAKSGKADVQMEKNDSATTDLANVKQATESYSSAETTQGTGVTAWYMGEVVQSAIGLASGMLQYSKEAVVESARPAYWEADADIIHCHGCKVKFDPKDDRYRTKHHCRACGKGFCDACSSFQELVPERGWNYPVRVCKSCAKILRQRN